MFSRRALILLVMVTSLTRAASAQMPTFPPRRVPQAIESGFVIPTGVLGVSIGAVVGGVAGGALSRGACERSRCNNVGHDALGGALIGAGVGLLIELAIRYSPFRR